MTSQVPRIAMLEVSDPAPYGLRHILNIDLAHSVTFLKISQPLPRPSQILRPHANTVVEYPESHVVRTMSRLEELAFDRVNL